MTPAEFSSTGKTLQLRTHLLDLRCPDFENTSEATEKIEEENFNAIRINSWEDLKVLTTFPQLDSNDYSEKTCPYVLWKPFDFLTENLDLLKKHLTVLQQSKDHEK